MKIRKNEGRMQSQMHGWEDVGQQTFKPRVFTLWPGSRSLLNSPGIGHSEHLTCDRHLAEHCHVYSHPSSNKQGGGEMFSVGDNLPTESLPIIISIFS